MISRRARALRREQQEKRRTNAPPSRKPDAPLGSLSSVALSCCISKATTLYNPFEGNVNSVTLLRHRLSTLRGAVQKIIAVIYVFEAKIAPFCQRWTDRLFVYRRFQPRKSLLFYWFRIIWTAFSALPEALTMKRLSFFRTRSQF